MSILLFDKESSVTSHQALTRIKKLFGFAKVGHGGTLDPFATGLLPIFCNEDTMFSRLCLKANKSYMVDCRLGVSTDTYDITGEITYRHPNSAPIPLSEIKKALQSYMGTILQKPPAYSAIKRNGVRLYHLARKCDDITDLSEKIPSRKITIFKCSIMHYFYPLLRLSISCSSGTYVRSLVHDLGKKLSCGATADGLRRTAISSFPVSLPMYSYKALQQNEKCIHNYLSSVDVIRPVNPTIELTQEAMEEIVHGRTISMAGVRLLGSAVDDFECLLKSPDGRVIGFGFSEKGSIKPTRLLPNKLLH